MVSQILTLALTGLEAKPVQVEAQVTGGEFGIYVVGLPSGAVRESRERVRGAFHGLGLSMPPKRITINLSPADITKDGSHYDLPIAVGILAALGIVPTDACDGMAVMGELGLDGSIRSVNGCLPAAIAAAGLGLRGFICPAANAGEAAWAGGAMGVYGFDTLNQLIRHLRGDEVVAAARPSAQGAAVGVDTGRDLRDIRGQETAKRVAEIAAAGGHHLLMSGPPGSGKSMLAARLPGLLPPLSATEALEISMIHSVAGTLGSTAGGAGLISQRPFRDPHHSASPVALTGGGMKAKPGEMSLAHRGVLFLDELPEFPRQVLETLRQPLETGTITISRANHHITYPARFQLIAAMNPCPCGYLGDPAKGCKKQSMCGAEYQAKLSGPLLDRFDLKIAVPAVKATDLSLPPAKDGTAEVAARVARARALQTQRYGGKVVCNAELQGALMDEFCPLDGESRALLNTAADKMGLSARGYHRVIRVARTLADLEEAADIRRGHLVEALGYRVG
ncbi:MAG: YifB family Mg chelatase-like AAA ATPase [Alphaproteobacteria bacterium]